MWHRFGMMDHQNALASLTATLLAVYHHRATGTPQFCTASLLGASILTTSETFVCPDGELAPYPKLDSKQMGVSPYHRIFECGDKRWIAVVAESDEEQQAFLAAVGVKAPGFELPGSDGKLHSLADHVGKRGVVIAWFPRAFTPG